MSTTQVESNRNLALALVDSSIDSATTKSYLATGLTNVKDYYVDDTSTASTDFVKLDILINGVSVDPLSLILHREKAYHKGYTLVKKLCSLIPRQLFEVSVQASIGSRVIAQETVTPIRKYVISKVYGGDISRKWILLAKQKEDKRCMKVIGNVEIPQEAFMAILSLGDEK